MKAILQSMLMIVAGTLMFSCNNDDNEIAGSENTSLVVSIYNESSDHTRRVGDGTVNSPLESVISNLTIFVFNYNTGTLEKMQSFTVSAEDNKKIVTGLTTGTTKRVVAFVNVPTNLDFSTITSYNDLHQNLITIDSQNSAADLSTVGLFMSGEYESALALSATEVKQISIGIKRRVAKVVLSSLIVNPDASSNLNLFSLGGVSIQRARLTGTPIGGLVHPAGDPATIYGGGFPSPSGASPAFNITKSYFVEPIPFDFTGYVPGTEIIGQATDRRYFYVLPNNNENGFATLLAIYGEYSGEQVFYPFVINDNTSTFGVLDPNVRYILSVTLRKINLPSTDPNIVPEEASVEVTLVPQDWEGPISQNVEW